MDKMATQRAMDEANIRRRMDEWAKAIRAMDVDGVASSYAPDIASFDLGPPLRHVGAQAKRRNWMGVFAMFQPPLGYEIRDLTITVGDDVAFGHSLEDQIFELVVCAAIGQATRQYDSALAALDAATRRS